MLELAISTGVRPKSLAMVIVNCRYKSTQRPRQPRKFFFEYSQVVGTHTYEQLVSLNRSEDGVHMHAGDVAYQDQKASMNANQANVNTRPYILIGFKPGIERAFRLIGLTSGARHRVVTSNMMSEQNEKLLAGDVQAWWDEEVQMARVESRIRISRA